MRLPRGLARFNKVATNRVQGRWAPYLLPWAVVRHSGRRTGRVYETPVFATRHGSRIALAVMYGTESDWVRNVLAAGRADVRRAGRTLAVADPELVDTAGLGLGWLGRYAEHAVVVRVVRGPGVRSFDPARLGESECAAWVGYYRRDWPRVLAGCYALVADGFGMGVRRSVIGAWYVLRANQKWAPYPDNDPGAAREHMRRFYALVVADGGLSIDPAEAARREVEWWRVHRAHQRENRFTDDALTAAVAQLYGYVYSLDEDVVRPAARLRVEAMALSDEWVAAGCDPADRLLTRERATLVASYRALRAVV